MHRMLPSNEDTRRLLYLSNLQRSSMSPGIRRDPSPQRRTLPDLSGNHQSQQQISLKRYQQQPDLSGNSQLQLKGLSYQHLDLSGNSKLTAKSPAYQQHPDLSGNSQVGKGLSYQHPDLSGNSKLPAKSTIYQQHLDLSGNSQRQAAKGLAYQQQQPDPVKRLAYPVHPPASGNAVSRRNARERKRVRLVNLGFSTLRERVPSGGGGTNKNNKKLSKVETLRSAIEYIRQLQEMLGMSPDDEMMEKMMGSENFNCLPDDCSSSEEGMMRGPGQSGDLSPASSHPSEGSMVQYESQHVDQDQLMDIGLWFS